MSHAQLLQTTQQLTYAAAAIGISAAVAKSNEIGVPECIAVVDAAGQLLAYARVEGAATLAREPAIAKAATAAALGMPGGGIPFEFGVNLGIASRDAIVNLGGGLPIVLEGHVVGAIGVGSRTTDEDIAVAEAGRDAVLAALAAFSSHRS